MEKFNIELTVEDLQIIASALADKPYGMVCKLINEIDTQIKEQSKENSN